MKRPRALFLSPIDMRASNGMSRLQQQLLSALCALYGDSVDLLSLGASTKQAQKWLADSGLEVKVLDGILPRLAWLNATLWYGGGAILCNKLKWIERFYFPIQTPLPEKCIQNYDVIVCFYPWLHRLLKLERAGRKVVVDTGDIMADRHERTGARRWISMTAEDERKVLHSPSRCLAVSRDDADEFERLYGVRLPVQFFVPANCEELIALAGKERPKRLGYMGAPSYVNEEVLRQLSHPDFLASVAAAGVEMVVAGGICDTVDPSVLRSLEAGGARILGRVPSTVEYYRSIGATVNPVGPSTGVKIKSVETLVAGRSLITTRWGADRDLAAAFPGQVVYIDWPMEPRELGELCARVTQETVQPGPEAADAYVRRAMQELKEMLQP